MRPGRRAGLRGVLLLALAVSLPAAAVVSSSMPAGEAAAYFGVGALDGAMLLAGDAARPVVAGCPDGEALRRRQALSHALGCWYALDGRGGWVFTRSSTLPSEGCTSRIHPSALAQRPGLEQQVQLSMAAFLGEPAGIAFNPIDASWVASLTQPGHQALVRLLSALERPGVIPPFASAAPPEVHGPALPAAAWPDQTAALVTTWGIAVAVAPETAAEAPAISAGSAAELPDRLRESGVQAAWINGVLCIGTPAIDRLHPGQRAAWVVIPVPHLAHRSGDEQRLATTITEAWPLAWKDQPGWMVAALKGSLFISADAAGIHHALATLAALDRAAE